MSERIAGGRRRRWNIKLRLLTVRSIWRTKCLRLHEYRLGTFDNSFSVIFFLFFFSSKLFCHLLTRTINFTFTLVCTIFLNRIGSGWSGCKTGSRKQHNFSNRYVNVKWNFDFADEILSAQQLLVVTRTIGAQLQLIVHVWALKR